MVYLRPVKTAALQLLIIPFVCLEACSAILRCYLPGSTYLVSSLLIPTFKVLNINCNLSKNEGIVSISRLSCFPFKTKHVCVFSKCF